MKSNRYVSGRLQRPASRRANIVNIAIGITLVFILGVLTGVDAMASDEFYFKVGTSYKVESSGVATLEGQKYKFEDRGSPIGARFELGKRAGKVSYGVSHFSQWDEGWPTNNDKEFSRTELFIDYEWSW